MKRLILTFIAMIFMLLCACSSGVSSYVDSNGNVVIETDDVRTISYSTLPAYIKYNESNITFEDVEFYQNYISGAYNGFAIIKLDVSNLDADTVAKLRKDDLKVSAFITSEKNEYDFERTMHLGNLLLEDEGKLLFVETTAFDKSNKHSFADSEIEISVDISQRDGGRETAMYTYEVASTAKSTAELNDTLASYIGQWLDTKGN